MIDNKISIIINDNKINNQTKEYFIINLLLNEESIIKIFGDDFIKNNLEYIKEALKNILNEKNIYQELKTNIFCSFLDDEFNFDRKNLFSKDFNWTNMEEHLN